MRLMAFVALGMVLTAASVEAQDVDPLAELAALGEAASAGPEGGGSIRAKKDADLTSSQRLKDPKNLEGKVEEVSTKDFPLVAVILKVTAPAKEGEGKAQAKNTTLVVVPKLKLTGKDVDLKDQPTLINAGAFYLKKGDKVAVRLGANKGKYWEADYIERK
jgi:hypothetical protein